MRWPALAAALPFTTARCAGTVVAGTRALRGDKLVVWPVRLRYGLAAGACEGWKCMCSWPSELGWVVRGGGRGGCGSCLDSTGVGCCWLVASALAPRAALDVA